MKRRAVIALEWGAILTGALVLSDGQVFTPQTTVMPQTLDAALDASHILIQHLSDQAVLQDLEIVGIGVGVHGLINAKEGLLYSSPLFKLWHNVRIVERLNALCHHSVILVNAAQAAALLEYESGAAARISHALYIHIAHSIDSAYLINGSIFQGAHDTRGSIGQLTADWRGEKPIPLDDVVTIPGIQRLYYSRTRIDERPTYEEIVQLALGGHSLAVKAIRDTARILGTLLPPVAALMGTGHIVVGGEVPQIGPLWWTAFESAFYSSRPPLTAPISLRQAHYGLYGVLCSVGRLGFRQFQ